MWRLGCGEAAELTIPICAWAAVEADATGAQVKTLGRLIPIYFRRRFSPAVILMLLVVGVGYTVVERWPRDQAAGAAAPQAIPVTVDQVTRRDVPIFLDGLGTVQAINTITIRSQIDGTLQSVDVVEGQEVRQGDTLAVIDSRALQATLDQAVARKSEDQAQLVAAQKDLDRFKALAAKSFETQQNLDQQQAKVDQLKATIDADQAAIESAQTQLSYATIKSPINGRAGFRQLDAGNIIHANDQTPLTVLTQVHPIVAIFTLPQRNLAEVREAMLRGPVTVNAYDQDTMRGLAQGELLLIDNQIDQATSTIRLKARFANGDDRLWPGEFVRVRIQVDTRKDAVTIPAVAVQRGPQGLYAWVVEKDNTAKQHPIEATTVDNDIAIVTKGLAAGDEVVTNGQYRLQDGSRVSTTTRQTDTAPGKPS
jgi:membrane fusion protein, multidrug efflux system